MPSYRNPTRQDSRGSTSSNLSSTLSLAASYALPASRAASPGIASPVGNKRVGLPSRQPSTFGQRDALEGNGSDSGKRWDDAWDSGSDDDTPTRVPLMSRQASSVTVTGSKGSSSMSRPMAPRSNTLHNPPSPTKPMNGLNNSGSDRSKIDTDGIGQSSSSQHGSNAPLAGLTRSFSFTHVSPPSPSSYENKSEYLPKAEWQVLETGEIVEAEQSYAPDNSSKSGMYGFGNDWQPEKKRSEPKSPGVSSLVSSALGFGSSRWRSASKEAKRPPLEGMMSGPVPEEKQKPREKVGKEALKEDVDNIVKDPLFSLKIEKDEDSTTDHHQPVQSVDQSMVNSVDLGTTAGKQSKPLGRAKSKRTERRRERFAKTLKGRITETGGGVDPSELRKMAWAGVPEDLRPIAWQMLLNYLPLPVQPRLTNLQRKRKEYGQLVNQAFGRGMTAVNAQIWHQIEIDVPRTRPGVPLWACEVTQRSLERILYVWAIRHPASGYVQGINDLVTPFFEVFLSAYVDCDPELFDTTQLPSHVLAAIEADSFWCLSKLLDGIQDNYVSAQPGIHRSVRRMAELVKRIDAPLAQHMEEQGVEFMQFAFRWMNCLLMREISVKCTIRMWDTYLAEGTDAFSQFHLYVCSAFLVKWSEKLQKMDFQEIIMFLQRLPTESWTDHNIELLLSEAFVLKSVWQGAENHFTGSIEGPLGGGMGGR